MQVVTLTWRKAIFLSLTTGCMFSSTLTVTTIGMLVLLGFSTPIAVVVAIHWLLSLDLMQCTCFKLILIPLRL